jgi:predicted transcriptional regulator
MPRSKLEVYIDIAKSLVEYGPLSLEEIASIIEIEADLLKQHTDVLIKQKIVQEKKNNNQDMLYEITEHGVKIIKFFKIVTAKKALQERKINYPQ